LAGLLRVRIPNAPFERVPQLAVGNDFRSVAANI